MGSNITFPFDPDTDKDGIPDGIDPNSLVPDDPRPGVYVIEWQRLEGASLMPVGWPSGQAGAVQPNYYQTIQVTATQRWPITTPTSDEFNRVNLSITRNRLAPVDFTGQQPNYREQTTYSYAAGKPYSSAFVNSPPDVGTWSSGDPGAIAFRFKHPGNDRYTYNWTYISPQNGVALPIGEFGQVFVPQELEGTLNQWEHSASSNPQGSNHSSSSAIINLPNQNYFPANGNPAANLNWSSSTTATGEKPEKSIASTWTLSNRLTYPLLRGELDQLRPNIKYEDVYSAGNTGLPVSAYYVQETGGEVTHQLYQFYFKKVPGMGGSGPSTILWTEIFTASDNPDTTTNEAAAPVTRTRAVTLLPNVAQSPTYTLDHRIAPFTVLPGESNAPKADGTTTVGDLPPIKIAVDYNRNGTAADDSSDLPLADQGAYNGQENQGAFRQTGVLVFANYSKDEDRVGGGKPLGDAIRYYHDGWNSFFTDEHYTILSGEDKLPPDAGTSQRGDPNYVRTNLKFPDFYPLQISKMGRLPSHYRVFLKVRSPEEKKAFHLYKKIAIGQNAIWGGGMDTATTVPAAPYSATDEVDITRWVNPAAPDYEETRENLLDANGQLITPLADRDYVFGIEGVLYKGQEIGSFEQPTQFKGYADIRMELRSPGTGSTQVPSLVGQVRITFVRKPAFPGAYGYGRWALGGSRGEVFTVDNLTDTTSGGPPTVNGLRQLNGTLRQALDYRNKDHHGKLIPRTVVFRKSGLLSLTKDLEVASFESDNRALSGLLTIAGQTAPIGGIMMRNGGLYVNGPSGVQANPNNYKRANDVVIRYLRVRPYAVGSGNSDADAVRLVGASDVILDHVSASWGQDGSMDITSSNTLFQDNPDQSVTAQWCLVAETLLPHSKASLFTGKWGSRYSCHHNFYANHESRMPEIGNWDNAVNPGGSGDRQGVIVDVRNNVFYHWGGDDCAHSTDTLNAEIRFNMFHNFFKRGPDSNEDIAFREKNGNCRVFFEGNRWDGSVWLSRDSYWEEDLASPRTLRADYWQGKLFTVEYTRSNTAPLGTYNWKTEVVAKSGDHRWRDAVDRRNASGVDTSMGKIFDQITSGRDYAIANQGHLASDYAADAWPVIPANDWGSSYDSDNDGIRDAWEGGSLPAMIPWQDSDGDGFTNLEEFLNLTSPNVGNDPMDELAQPHVEGVL